MNSHKSYRSRSSESLILLAMLCVLFLLPVCVYAKSPLAEIAANKIKLEVAQTKEQIERGLMFRSSLPEDQGMVFLFHPARKTSFWMFNCKISLDMLFIRDGKIIKICSEVPPCKSLNPRDCPTYPADGDIEVSEVLELNSGYCQRHGIKEGDSVKFSLPGFVGKEKDQAGSVDGGGESHGEAEK